MPGDVSDNYDPEFGTSSNAEIVRLGIADLVELLDRLLGDKRNIVSIARGLDGPSMTITLTERQLRLARFALTRAVETI